MLSAFNIIATWFKSYYGDGIYLVLALAAYLYLFVHYKKYRGRFLYPIGLVVFCIVNPLLYIIIFYRMVYWRLFWLLPNTLIIVIAVTQMIKNSKKKWEKFFVLAVFTGVIVIFGKNAYRENEFRFVENWYKLSGEVKDVCDIILKESSEPRCILPSSLFCEARQYSGEIQMMYGRNVQGYIFDASKTQLNVFEEMEKEIPDYAYILETAINENYDFLVTPKEKAINEEILLAYNYRELGNTKEYIVYHFDENKQ